MPAGDLFAEESAAAGSGGDEQSRAQLFAALNKGEDVTKGLKKVTSDMQTHKNPSLRSGPAPFTKPNVAPKPIGSVAASSPAMQKAVERPARKELEGKKWMIEYQKNQTGLVISETEMHQVVYIFKCEGSTIQVKGNCHIFLIIFYSSKFHYYLNITR
jgi:adenylyl cyclase-associated protein